jgi:hypothetical protein
MKALALCVLVMAACGFEPRGIHIDDSTDPAPVAPADPVPSPPGVAPMPLAPAPPAAPTPPPVPQGIGVECQRDRKSDCANGLECYGAGEKRNGYCTTRCDTTQQVCPVSGMSCVSDSGDRYCAIACPAQGCGDGFTCCKRSVPTGVCVLSSQCDD